MNQIFDGRLHVQYGQAYVVVPDHPGLELNDAFAGQSNGLCGAALPGALFLLTGLHTGWVGFAVEIVENAPPIDNSWEDIVEVSFHAPAATPALIDWYWQAVAEIPTLPGHNYRVRYSARGMDNGHALDTCPDDTLMADFYQLAFWRAAPASDAILKQTSRNAAYWHNWAQGLGSSTGDDKA